jgi:hypothetical protein
MRRDTDREHFKVQVRKANELFTHDLYIENDVAVMEFVAQLRPNKSYLKYRARIVDGEGSLPFGVASVSELIGRDVEIRVGDEVVLFAEIPGFDPLPKAKVEDDLDPTENAPIDAEAAIKLRSRPRKGDERFRVTVEDVDLAVGQELQLYLEDPDQPGTLVNQGAMVADEEGTDARFRSRTRQGQALPFEVNSTADLAGLAIEIRDADTGDVYFDGLVPAVR